MTALDTNHDVDDRAPRLYLNLPAFASSAPESWNHLFIRARAADAAGIDGLWVGEHLVLGERLDQYGRGDIGGDEGSAFPTDSNGLWLDPLVVLASVAGVTSRVRLLTSVLLAALRGPVVLAKTLATLDVLSNGRVDLGVSVGWQREEYEAAGVNFVDRGAVLDHVLSVCQTLWRENPATVHGERLNFESIHCLPQPIQTGGIPVWIGGRATKRTIGRIVRFGSGWIPWGTDRDDPRPGIELIRGELSRAGRDPRDLRILVPLSATTHERTLDPDEITGPMARFLESGVTDFRVAMNVPIDVQAATDRLRELVVAFRQASNSA